MKQLKIELLQENLAGLQLAAGHLQYSIERCRDLIGEETLPPEQLKRMVVAPSSTGSTEQKSGVGQTRQN